MHVTHENGFLNVGASIGSYAYGQFVSVSDAIQEATDFYNRMNSNSISCFIDVEEVTTNDPDDLIPATQAFIDYLHSKGVTKVGLYTGQSFYHTYGLSAIQCDFKIIARYGSNTGTVEGSIKPDVACDLWQYTSKAIVSGFPNPIDAQKINGSKPLSYFQAAEPPDEPSGDNPPTVPNYSASTNYNTLVTGQVIGTDIDEDPLTYSKSRSPYNGIVVVQSNGNWSYTPNTGFIGSDSFKVLVSDGTGNSATSTVTITISPPSLNPDPISSVVYSQYLTTVDNLPIYNQPNQSSTVVYTIQNKYSVIYYMANSISGSFGQIKYINDQNVTYYGYVDLTKIDTEENINNNNQIPDPQYYVVVSGDSIYSIASSLSITIEQLKLLNGWTNQKSVILTVGQQIRYK